MTTSFIILSPERHSTWY